MKAEFWHEKWEANIINFHQQEIHPMLKKYKSIFTSAMEQNVLVPLCGKTLDMDWLLDNNCFVTGVEFSKLAHNQYWNERNISPDQFSHKDFEITQRNKLKLYCGDFFNLTKEEYEKFNGPLSVIYDRASLIALPKEMRIKYYKTIKELSSDHTKWFLITLEFDDALLTGPPFNIKSSELEEYRSDDFVIELFEKNLTAALSHKFKQASINEVTETIYCLTKKRSKK